VIYGYGTSISPATGLWNGIDLDNGMRFRGMHYSRLVRTSGRVRRGEIIAYSGATGYGKADWSADPNTGGAHVHGTLWPTHQTRFGYQPNGKPYTIDFMAHADLSGTAGSGSNPFEEDDMPLNDTDLQKISDKVAATIRDWVRFSVPGRDVTTFDTFVRDTYGTLDKLINAVRAIPGADVSAIAEEIWDFRMEHPLNPAAMVPARDFLRYEPAEHEGTRRAAAQQSAGIAAIQEVVAQLAAANGAVLDMAAVEAAAERGAREALADLKVTIEGVEG
jgi:hypothetical protein